MVIPLSLPSFSLRLITLRGKDTKPNKNKSVETTGLNNNDCPAAGMELSTLECLRSFHLGQAVGMFQEGAVKLLVFYFRLSYYQFIWGIRL